MYVFTCFHFPIQGSRSIEHQTLNLQELIWFVSSNYGEAETTPALLQFSVNECPLQFCWVPCEKWLPSCNNTSSVNLRDTGLCEDASDDPCTMRLLWTPLCTMEQILSAFWDYLGYIYSKNEFTLNEAEIVRLY